MRQVAQNQKKGYPLVNPHLRKQKKLFQRCTRTHALLFPRPYHRTGKIVMTPVRVVILYISDYFCCFFEGHSSF